MDLDTWKAAIKESIEPRVHQLEQLAPVTLYGTLAAVTLRPVIAAVNQGNFAILTSLGEVVGSQGGYLITTRLAIWQNYSEIELALDLAEKAMANPAWREALDMLLDKLDVLGSLYAMLDEMNKTKAMSMLQQALDQVSSHFRLDEEDRLGRAKQSDTRSSDLIQAQIGEEARNVVVGKNQRVTIVEQTDTWNQYGAIETMMIQSALFQMPPEPGRIAPQHLLWTYLNQVVRDTSTLDLTGVDRKTVSDQEQTQLDLAAIYTGLDILRTAPVLITEPGDSIVTETGDSITSRPDQRQSVLSFVNETTYAVLLGDPGSGKTTFANFLALCLAGEFLGLQHANLARLGAEWTAGALLPIRGTLRNFAAQLETLASQNQTDRLWLYLVQNLGHSLAGFEELLKKHLLEEGGILILDGFDEVPAAARQRETVKLAISNFRRQFPRVRILLTSRTFAYQRQQWRLADFTEAVLAPFNDTQIQIFIDKWYTYLCQVRSTLTAENSQGRATLLKQAIQRNSYLHELAPRPLLLTLMASLHAWRGGSLPEQREELYEASVDLLLDVWERPKIVYDRHGQALLQTESAAEWFQAPRQRIQQVLEELAFTVHQAQGSLTGTADMNESWLVTALLKVSEPDTKPMRIIEYIRDRTGLLINRGEGVYSFPHRTFEEYLAARYLTRAHFPKRLVELVRNEPERWREVLLLAGARVARGTPYAAWSLLNRLCPQASNPEQVEHITDTEWWTAILAGQLLVETGIYKIDPLDAVEKQILDCIITWLRHLLESNHLLPHARTIAGMALGILGDPRPGVGLRKDGLPDIAWSKVAAGPFLIGSEPLTWSQLQESYAISYYPITVIQYNAFTSAGGYARKEYWTEAGWQWQQTARITGPQSYENVFQISNHPQVGVSWYEAVAFCNWLSAQLGYRVGLPTEPQWERAARHQDGRTYTWGNEFNAQRCNMRDTGIGHSTAVGLFSSSHAACGAADLSGNVWEWCITQWQSNYLADTQRIDDLDIVARRVLRGGSFSSTRRLVRCAQRHRDYPNSRAFNIGFRIMTA